MKHQEKEVWNEPFEILVSKGHLALIDAFDLFMALFFYLIKLFLPENFHSEFIYDSFVRERNEMRMGGEVKREGGEGERGEEENSNHCLNGRKKCSFIYIKKNLHERLDFMNACKLRKILTHV